MKTNLEPSGLVDADNRGLDDKIFVGVSSDFCQVIWKRSNETDVSKKSFKEAAAATAAAAAAAEEPFLFMRNEHE